ncbi:rRNA methyltransferase, putative [Trypanosoma equiperdum]|uniref:rRNA methyltransferase, putative n=4 Tax=Trypanozoon TaxID=39700 RepID=Q57Y21_TRYB2|nr:rRNA methyltransferase, putative [Trypanosoma brucei brucei TREU927]AAX69513.1 rRNA methyltransferase, putative [Trypanosoma brucei]RHW72774.1 rRNA methyltransferase [Trypanosoma brucei equiperdum]SCU72221.1 rRNA methyltransferase, putative [Trypanosoma equiperdum]AAX80113.1 hypothetical protein Tb04.30K5.570 [Trypanosoma brucei]AAZ11008.1 rRNA methyltransferase, putative [Trypanosoma brucei brucei TREU927]
MYRCRSAYKLLELDDKFSLFGGCCRTVVDLAAAPGGFSEVALQRMTAAEDVTSRPPVKPLVIAFDTRPMKAARDLHVVQCNINDHKRVIASVEEFIQRRGVGDGADRQVDVVLHDGVSVAKSHSAFSVTYAQNQMAVGALRLACALFLLSSQPAGTRQPPRAEDGLASSSKAEPQGPTFVTKAMRSAHFNQVLSAMKAYFRHVSVHRPAECNAASSETYVVARGFMSHARNRRNPLFLNQRQRLLSLPPFSEDVLPGRQIVWRCWGCHMYCMGAAPCINCSRVD